MPGNARHPSGMHTTMQRVSRWLSAFALTLMALGLALALLHGGADQPLRLGLAQRSHRLMLFGLVVLAVLPGVRVLIALTYYTAARRLAEALVALVVVMELIASMITRG